VCKRVCPHILEPENLEGEGKTKSGRWRAREQDRRKLGGWARSLTRVFWEGREATKEDRRTGVKSKGEKLQEGSSSDGKALYGKNPNNLKKLT